MYMFMSKFIVEIRIGFGTITHKVLATNKEEALSIVKQKLENVGLHNQLPKNVEAFSKIIEVK